MEEILKITEKYDAEYVGQEFQTVESVNKFALTFYKDVAAIYDCLVRVRNLDRNSTGFSLADAPILGLLVRISKILAEMIRYYEEDKAEFIAIFERPLLESAIVASFLCRSSAEVVEDYRKCSYKNRISIVKDIEAGTDFAQSKAGQRLYESVREKLSNESLALEDFREQEARKWKLQGKSFRQIFATIEPDHLYPSSYGMMSETIHGSWNESMDWSLLRNEDGTFSTNPFHHTADIRYVTPILKYSIRPYRLWLKRIDAEDSFLYGQLDWIERVNTAIFYKFDALFDD